MLCCDAGSVLCCVVMLGVCCCVCDAACVLCCVVMLGVCCVV